MEIHTTSPMIRKLELRHHAKLIKCPDHRGFYYHRNHTFLGWFTQLAEVGQCPGISLGINEATETNPGMCRQVYGSLHNIYIWSPPQDAIYIHIYIHSYYIYTHNIYIICRHNISIHLSIYIYIHMYIFCPQKMDSNESHMGRNSSPTGYTLTCSRHNIATKYLTTLLLVFWANVHANHKPKTRVWSWICPLTSGKQT